MIGELTETRKSTGRRDLLVVVNARASSAEEPAFLMAHIEAALSGAGARPSTVLTHSERELRDALESADGRRVVLVGGDGSVNAAVNSGVELPEIALIPAGKANNVARALGIPGRVGDAAKLAAGAPARPVDVLRVESGRNTLYSLESVSAGLHADARARYHGENSGDITEGARSLAAALRRFRPYELELGADGVPVHSGHAAQVFLSNLPFFAYGFRVDPVANPADGLLEAIVLEAESRMEAIGLILAAYRGRHLRGRHAAKLVRAHEATIDSPLPLTADALPLGVGRAKVTVEQGKLRVAAPWRQ